MHHGTWCEFVPVCIEHCFGTENQTGTKSDLLVSNKKKPNRRTAGRGESRWNRGIPCTDIIHTAQIQLSTQIPIPEKERVERTEERKNSPFHHRRLPSGSYPGYLWSPSRTPLPHSYRILHLLRQIVDLLLWPIIPLRRLELGVDEVLILLWVDLLLRVRQNIDRLYFQQGCR